MTSRIGNEQRVANSAEHRAHRARLSAAGCRLTANKGLTLIEVLLAVSILAVGLAGVLRAYAGSVAALEAAQYGINGISLLKQKMADIEQMVFEQEKVPPGSGRGTFENAFEDFLWAWEIKQTETKDLNELTLTVSHKYDPRTFSLKTYVVDKKEEKEK